MPCCGKCQKARRRNYQGTITCYMWVEPKVICYSEHKTLGSTVFACVETSMGQNTIFGVL